ncbi:unnamed protein product [Closterium sp. NIES-64]|nr:unnamed protein product [Closterium sp. NIES-65]CAI6000755.1 unnamed protein product [Closterium sp. NIES-64]
MASNHEIPLLPSPSSRLSPSSRAHLTNVAGDLSRDSRFRRHTAWVSFTLAAALLLLLLELEILPLPSNHSRSYTSESDVAHSQPRGLAEPREFELPSYANSYESDFVRFSRFRDEESASSESLKSSEKWHKRVVQLPRLRAEQRRARKAQRHGGKPPGDGAGGSGRGGVGLRLWPMPVEIAAEGSGEVVVSPNLRLDISFGGGPSLLNGRRREVNAELHMGVDESYELSIPHAPPQLATRHGHAIANMSATIRASTTIGALRALETLSQLCVFDFVARAVTIRGSPLLIRDAPRFQHRGLLIDTARHFLPVPVMERVIDSMAYAKLNVLHWHMVDSQSFPIETPSFPRLWLGAFSPSERYTTDDMRHIVQYAEERGVIVVPELDSPAHAASWGVGYPTLLPAAACPEPLDVSNPFTFQLIKGVLQDLRAVFKSSHIHLGGDEVSFECWNSSPAISAWLQQRKLTAEGGYGYFVRRVQALAVEAGWQTTVVWEEPFKVFGADLDPATTIVQNWFDTALPPAIVQSGFRMIFSNLNLGWYLDFVDRTWSEVYSQEPTAGVPEALQHLVVGGETCMWGERVDPSDLLNTVWPRAAAAAGEMIVVLQLPLLPEG